ncbi:MAG: arsenosugar biosynthesis radical SAM (seleno)protein ArsS [Candidatus Scalindua sp.]
MNAFLKILEQHDLSHDSLCREELTTLQVNMGNLCNQSCRHCHIEASPNGKNIMSKEVVDHNLAFLSKYQIRTLDITGGAPELNPHFEYLIMGARDLVPELIVRSNLTVLLEKSKDQLPKFYKKYNVHLICSLPCYRKENVDSQRGTMVFEKSIEALRRLNDLGFSTSEGPELDLVYNPTGPHLPPQQERLEKEYKEVLQSHYGINFNRLITITNVPIKRFEDFLKSCGEYDEYYDLLKNHFNPYVFGNLMCRTYLSVGFDGKLYDCDFNQALGWSLKDARGDILTIANVNPYELEGRKIIIGEHCLSCTAGYGSSCRGVITHPEREELSAHITEQDDDKTKEGAIRRSGRY